MKYNKYQLYEKSVQSPELHLKHFDQIASELQGKPALRFREDFCGTFNIACHWVKSSPKRSAIGVDLDDEPLSYGKKKHYKKLSSNQKSRIQILQNDVLKVKTKPVDLIAACNFSFYIFKERKVLLQYFRNCLKTLAPGGMLLLEMAGGPGMIIKSREQRTIEQKFTYIWDQKSFDPITHDVFYSIHFKFPSGKIDRDVFIYDWRLWTIPEVKDLLLEAGFSQVHVYWETSYKGEGTGEFVKMEKGDNAYAWIAYVIGVNRRDSP